MLFLVLNVSAQNENTNQLPESFVGKSLKSTLKYLHNEFDMEFAYDVELIKGKVCLEGYAYNNPEDLLVKIISPFGLSHRKAGKIYIILPTDELDLKLRPGEISKTDFDLSGRVIDQNTGEPLPYAFLRFKGTNLWTESNIDGYFNFTKIPNDTLLMAVNYLGYNLFLERVNQIDTDNLIIALHVHGSSLTQVDIITEKIEAIDLDGQMSFHQIDPGQIDLISGNGQPDLIKGLQLLAGVQTGDASSSTLSIRASKDSENLVLWDGIPLYQLSHFFGTFSVLNPRVVKNIRLYKSAYGAEFGGRVGGVLDITAKDGDLRKTKVNLNLNLIGAGIFVETPIIKNKTSLAIGFRQSHVNQFKTDIYKNLLEINFQEGIIGENFAKNFSITDDAKTSFYDFNVKVKHKLNESTNLSFNLIHAKDEYANTLVRKFDGLNVGQEFVITSFDDSNWGSLGLGLSLNKQWSDGAHTTVNIHRSSFNSRYFFNDNTEELQFSDVVAQRVNSGNDINEMLDQGILISHLIDVEKHKLKFGLNFQQFVQKNRNLDSQTSIVSGGSYQPSEGQSNLTSFYFTDKFKINNKFSTEFGVRLNKYSKENDIKLSPRGQLRYSSNEDWSFRIGAGVYRQFVRKVANERLALNQPDEWQIANDDIPIAKSHQLTGAIYYEKADWKVKIESYFIDNEGVLINRSEDSLQTIVPLNNEIILIGESQVVGVDVSILKTYKNHSGWIAYSLSKATNIFDEINDGKPFNYLDNRLHDFKLNYQFRIRNWAVSTSYILASGKYYTPILGTFTNDLSGEQFLVYGDDYSVQLPNYSRWDVGVKYNLKIKKNMLQLGVGVYNILNRNNISQRTYEAYKLGSAIDSQLIVNTIDLELLGISPNFSFSYTIN